ncbi:MAG: low molecular weight phosphatase family protein [Chloroflexi bacterium]|nr:low molecular weight phosphatase family protein [Chloroflexota bacterium]
MNVLFVCNGNVARSQIAETMFNHLSDHQATSAGTAVRHLDVEGQTIKAHSESPGAPVTPGIVLELMQEKGFDLSNNMRNQVTPEMVDSADRVILMLGKIPPENFLTQSQHAAVLTLKTGVKSDGTFIARHSTCFSPGASVSL